MVDHLSVAESRNIHAKGLTTFITCITYKMELRTTELESGLGTLVTMLNQNGMIEESYKSH